MPLKYQMPSLTYTCKKRCRKLTIFHVNPWTNSQILWSAIICGLHCKLWARDIGLLLISIPYSSLTCLPLAVIFSQSSSHLWPMWCIIAAAVSSDQSFCWWNIIQQTVWIGPFGWEVWGSYEKGKFHCRGILDRNLLDYFGQESPGLEAYLHSEIAVPIVPPPPHSSLAWMIQPACLYYQWSPSGIKPSYLMLAKAS